MVAAYCHQKRGGRGRVPGDGKGGADRAGAEPREPGGRFTTVLPAAGRQVAGTILVEE